jgi:hypothetical protein
MPLSKIETEDQTNNPGQSAGISSLGAVRLESSPHNPSNMNTLLINNLE